MVSPAGIEPATNRLKACGSTTELRTHSNQVFNEREQDIVYHKYVYAYHPFKIIYCCLCVCGICRIVIGI